MHQHEYFNGELYIPKKNTEKIITFLLTCKEFQKKYSAKIVKYMQQKIIMHYLNTTNIPTMHQLQKIEPQQYTGMNDLPIIHSNIINYEYIETKYHTFEPRYRFNCWGREYYELTIDSSIHYPRHHYGYRNLKILTNTDMVEEIELELGGTQMDKIYPSKFKNNLSFDLLQHNVIPITVLRTVKIGIICKSQTKISYDIVKITNLLDKYILGFKELQYCGTEIINKETVNWKLYFHHQIYKIIAYLPPCTKNVILYLTPLCYSDTYELSMIKSDSYWEIDFNQHGLNFQKFQFCYLSCESDGGKYTAEICAISQNFLQVAYGIYCKYHY